MVEVPMTPPTAMVLVSGEVLSGSTVVEARGRVIPSADEDATPSPPGDALENMNVDRRLLPGSEKGVSTRTPTASQGHAPPKMVTAQSLNRGSMASSHFSPQKGLNPKVDPV